MSFSNDICLFIKQNKISIPGLDYFPPFRYTLQFEYSNVRNGITNCKGGTLRRGQRDNNEVTKQASQNIGNGCEIVRWSETCDFAQKRVGPIDFCLHLLPQRSLFSCYWFNCLFNCYLIVIFDSTIFNCNLLYTYLYMYLANRYSCILLHLMSLKKIITSSSAWRNTTRKCDTEYKLWPDYEQINFLLFHTSSNRRTSFRYSIDRSSRVRHYLWKHLSRETSSQWHGIILNDPSSKSS